MSGQVAGGVPASAETTFLLVRHGATAHTAQRRFSGCTGTDPALSPLGQWQARSLAARLAQVAGVAAVVSSPMTRARQTAQLIVDSCGVAVHEETDVREVDFGDWQGRTLAEVRHGWPSELAAWRASPSVAPPAGESVEAVAARVARLRRSLAARHPGAVVVLVSHLYPVRLSVLDAIAAPYASVHRMALHPTALSEIRIDASGDGTLVGYNDVAHLAHWPTPDQ